MLHSAILNDWDNVAMIGEGSPEGVATLHAKLRGATDPYPAEYLIDGAALYIVCNGMGYSMRRWIHKSQSARLLAQRFNVAGVSLFSPE